MKRLMTAALALITAACQPLGDADEFREASPSRQGVEIKLPESGAQGLSSDELGQSRQPLLGQRAVWYEQTRAITGVVNGGAAWVLRLCEEIIGNEPTTLTEDQAVWGPHTGDLSPITYRFTVTRAAEGFDYQLEGKAKEADDGAYVKVIYGHHVPGAEEKAGSGSFTVDWNAASTLPEHDANVGAATFTYSRNAALDVTIRVRFSRVRDEQSGQLVDAEYAFSRLGVGGGTFEFVMHKDLEDLPNNTAALERLAVMSRWVQGGAGRCDIEVSGGDLAAPVTLSECWSPTFLETFYTDSFPFTADQGEESSCVFTPASYTGL